MLAASSTSATRRQRVPHRGRGAFVRPRSAGGRGTADHGQLGDIPGGLPRGNRGARSGLLCGQLRLSASPRGSRWNADLGARKLARESRDASSAMGRRFLRLAANISGDEVADHRIRSWERRFTWQLALVWLPASSESNLPPAVRGLSAAIDDGAGLRLPTPIAAWPNASAPDSLELEARHYRRRGARRHRALAGQLLHALA